ncbi:MAG: N-acetyl-gamma-glutamyl-phosphate reductase [Thiotrichales bacterium]
MIKCGIVGATGYTGVELLRLLALHPEVEIATVTSRAEAGRSVDQLFSNLRGWVDLRFVAPEQAELERCDIVFFATPNGTAMQQAPQLLRAGVRVIDLAADFRLSDPQVWEQWYGMPHACPELLSEAVYGLPELNREAIREARLVANPGCYPTATTLAALPLLRSGLIDVTQVIADAKSGVSGAGRKAEVHTLLSEASDNFKAYAVSGHRHLPEITQTLSRYAGREVGVTFVPHLVPMIRGIHVTFYATLTSNCDSYQAVYEEFYEGSHFVDVLPPGSHPETRSCRGANVCRIAIHRPQNASRLVVLAVIDNLVKGAAGQAVQNMNLMLGLPESLGLNSPALLP